MAEKPPVVVKTYEAKKQADAAKEFAEDAAVMAKQGYRPVSQSWAEGKIGVGRAVALGFASLMFKPAGTLTVTYTLQE
jgi:hypothetical protein